MPGKHLGFKKLTLKSISVPGNFLMAQRLEAQHVVELSRSVTTHGLLEPVIVLDREAGSYELVAGGDRYAAHLIAGLKYIWASLWEATTREAMEMQLIENGHRRHSKEEQASVRQQLISLYSEDVAREGLSPDLAKKEVVARVAAALAVKPESVERTERRVEQKKRERAERPPKPIDDGIKTLGIELNAEWNVAAAKHRRLVSDAAKSFTRALQLLAEAAREHSTNPAHKAPLPSTMREQQLLRLHQETARLGKEVRGAIPTSLCPYCKALEGAMENCGPCGGTALLTSGQWVSVPPELLETGKKAMIVVGGRRYTVLEWENERSPQPEPGLVVEDDPWGALG